jgi:hypothetical protein
MNCTDANHGYKSGGALSQKATFLTLALATLLLCVANAGATTSLYSNLGPSGQYDSAKYWYVDGANYTDQVIAEQFTPSASMNIADAVLALGNSAGGNNPLNVYLESDSGGLPGTVMDTMVQQGTIPPLSSGGGLVQFNCTSCPVLNAGTQYWIVGYEPDPNTSQAWMWSYQDQPGNLAYNRDGQYQNDWNAIYTTAPGLQVDGGAPVPEPGTLVMLGSGILASAVGLRRKLGV